MLQDFLEALLSSFWLPHTSSLGNITQRCSWFDASFYLLCRLLLLITLGSTIVPDPYFGFGNSFCFWRRQMCQTFHFRNSETKQHLVLGLTHLIAYSTHQIASVQDMVCQQCPVLDIDPHPQTDHTLMKQYGILVSLNWFWSFSMFNGRKMLQGKCISVFCLRGWCSPYVVVVENSVPKPSDRCGCRWGHLCLPLPLTTVNGVASWLRSSGHSWQIMYIYGSCALSFPELLGQKQEKSFVGGVSFVVADGKCSFLGIFCVAMTRMCK